MDITWSAKVFVAKIQLRSRLEYSETLVFLVLFCVAIVKHFS